MDNITAPPGIDMSLIREALQRRRTGDIRTPPTGQVTLPGGATPGGGPNTPVAAVPPTTPPAGATTPPAGGAAPAPTARTDQNVLGGLQAGQTIKSSPLVDDETKNIAKVLIRKLMDLM